MRTHKIIDETLTATVKLGPVLASTLLFPSLFIKFNVLNTQERKSGEVRRARTHIQKIADEALTAAIELEVVLLTSTLIFPHHSAG